MDHRSIHGPEKRDLIDLQHEQDVRYWSERLRASPAELREAVHIIGATPDRVRDFISRERVLQGR
ncbi:MAG: DUF3606 domain-containing protein [Betaproteobacteria bacterium]|nr:DUF3606 domain-containing protein [Betaproteobacteria bacterium]